MRQPHRPTRHPTEVVLPHRRAGEAIALGKPVISVQFVVAEIIEERAMKSIGAAAGDDGDLATGRAAKLRGKGGSLYLKLLHGIDGNQRVGATGRTQRRHHPIGGGGERRAGHDAEVGADAVHREGIGAGALAIDGKLPRVA